MAADVSAFDGSLEHLAVLVVDPQIDFCDPGGVYARHGIDIAPVRRILEPLSALMQACRTRSVPIIATQFTILDDHRGKALLGPVLLAARPFLASEGFRPGSPGHGIVPELPRADFLIEKPTFSAFFASRLDYLLDRLGVTRLLMSGVGTNGAVESTLRDAQVRDFELTLVTDCTAGFRQDLHDVSVKNMAGLARTAVSQAIIERLAESCPNAEAGSL